MVLLVTPSTDYVCLKRQITQAIECLQTTCLMHQSRSGPRAAVSHKLKHQIAFRPPAFQPDEEPAGIADLPRQTRCVGLQWVAPPSPRWSRASLFWACRSAARRMCNSSGWRPKTLFCGFIHTKTCRKTEQRSCCAEVHSYKHILCVGD